MGINCCNYTQKPKEKEVLFPNLINYNTYETNNNENIIANTMDQDKISNNSQKYGYDKKYANTEYSPYIDNIDNKCKKTFPTEKNSNLGKIEEKSQNYEKEQENNSNNEDFCEFEKILSYINPHNKP